MAITAADVKKLRDATGAGMMDAKKALTEADGDFERAIELLRVAGQAKMAKRSDRSASNGLVAASGNALIQLASETDFVAKNEEFIALAQDIAEAANREKTPSKLELGAVTLWQDKESSVNDAIEDLAAKIGEKLELADAAYFDGRVSTYLHRRNQDLPPQVGVMVEYDGGDDEFGHLLGMQIAAMSPKYVSRDEVPETDVENEKRIAEETAREEKKPEQAIPRIVEGRLNGYYKDVCLLDQPAVSDDKKSVAQLAKDAGVTIKRFVRFAAGA